MIFRHLLFISESKCNTSDSSSQCTDMHAVGLSLKALSLGIIFIISIAMNVTICLVFYKKSQLLTVSNTFVLNLIGCQLGEYFFFFFFWQCNFKCYKLTGVIPLLILIVVPLSHFCDDSLILTLNCTIGPFVHITVLFRHQSCIEMSYTRLTRIVHIFTSTHIKTTFSINFEGFQQIPRYNHKLILIMEYIAYYYP